MFDKKSDYAQNKRKRDAIIYTSTTGPILLTRADFANEEEFQKWKDWSDSDYRASEEVGRGFYDNTISFDGKLETICSVLSFEENLFNRPEEAEQRWLSAALIILQIIPQNRG
jgi:hypothetical protein